MKTKKGINRELDPGQMFHDNSEMIGTDIDDLQEFAGRNVITEREFNKMFTKCECGHFAPPEFIYTDSEGLDTCANCIVDHLQNP